MSRIVPANGVPAARHRRTGIHSEIVSTIGREIVGGLMKPSERLPPESDLLARFGASRTALREAMKVLTSKGLVEPRQRAGTRVRARAEWDLLDPEVLSWHPPESIGASFTADLVELRELIEPKSARFAAMRATPRDVERIEAAFSRMERAVTDYEAFYEADRDFHLAVLEASHNQLVERLSPIVGTVLNLGFRMQKEARIRLEESLPSHREVLRAISQREPEAAERAMQHTIDRGKNTLALRGKLADARAR